MEKKEDLRVKKTHIALYNAMFTVLAHRNFNDITVNDICYEALISRTTFYVHFSDKYNLLKYFLKQIRETIVKDIYNYDDLEHEINNFVYSNKKQITNILKDANNETLTLIHESMALIVDMIIKRDISDKSDPQYIILFNFCTGGLMNLLIWIVENDFPENLPMMSKYLYKMLNSLALWDSQQK